MCEHFACAFTIWRKGRTARFSVRARNPWPILRIYIRIDLNLDLRRVFGHVAWVQHDFSAARRSVAAASLAGEAPKFGDGPA